MSDKTVEQIDAEIQKLQDARAEVVRLNEEKKPRFGDYVIYNTDFGGDGPFRVFGKSNNILRGFTKHGNDQGNAEAKCYTVIGNIFDDLEAAGPDGILLPLTRSEALEFMDHRRGETYTFGPSFDKLKHRIEAKLK